MLVPIFENQAFTTRRSAGNPAAGMLLERRGGTARLRPRERNDAALHPTCCVYIDM